MTLLEVEVELQLVVAVLHPKPLHLVRQPSHIVSHSQQQVELVASFLVLARAIMDNSMASL